MLQGMCKGVDGGLLFTGNFQYWGPAAWLKCLVLKTDKDGNEIWRKKISKALPDVQDGKCITQDSSTRKIYIAGYQYIGNATSWGSFGNVVIADSLGNKLSQFAYNNYNGDGLADIVQLKDKSFLVCGQRNANNDLSSNRRFYSFITRFDTNGSVVWKKDYDVLSIWTSILLMQQMPNGNVLVAGYLDTMSNKNVGGVVDIPPVVKIKLMEIDPANGAVIKTRFIGNGAGLNTIEFPRSLRPTKDGGYVLAVNDADRMNPKPMSLIKIDANLCDTSDAYCREQDEVGLFNAPNTNNRIKLFPTPASTQITIESDAAIESISIYSASGSLVAKIANTNYTNTLSVPVKDLSSGLYHIAIQTLNQNVIIQKLTITR